MQRCPQEFVQFANHLADIGGDIHRRYYRKPIAVEIKGDGSPVTQVDKETEYALRGLIEQTYPDHGVMGEEYPSVRGDAEFVWVLDPVDGTKSYLAGVPLFGILIALAHGGRFVLGVVEQPILRDRWVGADGHGTTWNKAAVHTRPCATLSEAVLCAAGPDNRTEVYDHQVVSLRRGVKWVRYGVECYSYGLVASGLVDLLVDAELDNHDFGALDPIVRNAGGIVVDWRGKPLTMQSDGTVIAAGDPELIDQVLSRVRPD
ncbi:MAG: inositol monophosphatase family protein [Acidiferrobacterales bacterium]